MSVVSILLSLLVFNISTTTQTPYPHGMHRLIINRISDHQSQFRLLMQSGDISGLSELVLTHPEVTFLDLNISVFNQIVEASSNLYHGDSLERSIIFLFNDVVPRYHLLINTQTYHILASKFRKNRAFIAKLHQPNADHPHVSRVVYRLLEVQYIKQKYYYTDYYKRHSQQRPQTPDILMHYVGRSAWRSILSEWGEDLRGNISMLVNQSSQIQLVRAMDESTKAHADLGSDLALSVWKKFFTKFYSLPNQYRDRYVCQLLGKMSERGSRNKPDLATFQIIVEGISKNDGIRDAESLIDLVVHDIMPWHNVTADEHIYSVYFALMEKNDNVRGLMDLVRRHPMIAFVHDDINAFNSVVSNLPGYVAEHEHREDVATALLAHVMKRHHLRFNDKTRKLLRSLQEICPGLRNRTLRLPLKYGRNYRLSQKNQRQYLF